MSVFNDTEPEILSKIFDDIYGKKLYNVPTNTKQWIKVTSNRRWYKLGNPSRKRIDWQKKNWLLYPFPTTMRNVHS